MKYVARSWSDPAGNSFLLTTAPLAVVKAGQTQIFPHRKKVLTLKETLKKLIFIVGEFFCAV